MFFFFPFQAVGGRGAFLTIGCVYNLERKNDIYLHLHLQKSTKSEIISSAVRPLSATLFHNNLGRPIRAKWTASNQQPICHPPWHIRKSNHSISLNCDRQFILNIFLYLDRDSAPKLNLGWRSGSTHPHEINSGSNRSWVGGAHHTPAKHRAGLTLLSFGLPSNCCNLPTSARCNCFHTSLWAGELMCGTPRLQFARNKRVWLSDKFSALGHHELTFSRYSGCTTRICPFLIFPFVLAIS
jgi:hypothetical protein